MIASDRIRAVIVETIQGAVTTAGARVHNRERYIKNASGLKALYLKDNGAEEEILHGWFVRHNARLPNVRHVIDRWLLQGYYGFVDEASSEIAFDQTIDALITAFAKQPLFEGVVTAIPEKGPSGLQVETIEPVMFAGVLCHQATCRLETKFFIAPAS